MRALARWRYKSARPRKSSALNASKRRLMRLARISRLNRGAPQGVFNSPRLGRPVNPAVVFAIRVRPVDLPPQPPASWLKEVSLLIASSQMCCSARAARIRPAANTRWAPVAAKGLPETLQRQGLRAGRWVNCRTAYPGAPAPATARPALGGRSEATSRRIIGHGLDRPGAAIGAHRPI